MADSPFGNTRIANAAIIAALILALGACSDSGSNGKVDAGSDGQARDGAVADGPASDGPRADQQGTDQGGGGDAGALKLSCAALQFCQGCCADQDQPCRDACMATLGEDSKQAWEDLQGCAARNCKDCSSDADCTACVEGKCPAEKAACNFGAGGAATCAKTFTCIEACPQMTVDHSGTAATCPADPGIVCLQQCMHAATATAATAVYAVGYCRYAKCGGPCFTPGQEAECDTCMAGSCGDEQKACETSP